MNEIKALALDIDGTITDSNRLLCISAIEIIRKIENNDLLTSSPYVYFNKENSSYIFFFPLIGDSTPELTSTP